MRAADALYAHFREADSADVAGCHQLGHGADGVFDGDRGVVPRRAVEIDVIHAPPLQTGGHEILHRRGTRVEAEPASIGTAHGAELDGNQRLSAAAPELPAEEHFVVPHAIEIAGVE